jgi:transposase
MSVMPAPHSPEFRQRAVQLVREGTASVAKIAKDLGISESCLRNWMTQSDADDNGDPRLTARKRKSWPSCGAVTGCWSRRMRSCGAAAYFARENVLPKLGSGGSMSLLLTARMSRWPVGQYHLVKSSEN